MARFALTTTVKLTSGYQMPIIGLGVYQNYSCIPACEAALKHGYRHIDTAQVYRNEKDVGVAVRDSGVPREEIFVTTKIIQNQKMEAYASALQTVEQSLELLGFTYIDLYLIHSPHSGKQRRLDTYRGLLEMQKKGFIRSVGVSNYGVHHLEEIAEAGLPTPTVNQIELHPLCQQKPIVEYCNKHNIVVQAYCPLIRGDFSSPVLQEVSKSVKKDPSQVLVRWSIQRGFVPLPKSSDPERVRSNVDIFDFELSDENMAKLDGLDKGKEGAISWNPVDVE